jgi:dolichol kinase
VAVPPQAPAQREISFVQELWRKATHLGGLIIPCGYYFLGLEKGAVLAILVPFTLLVILTDISRLRGWWFWHGLMGKLFSRMIRSHEQNGDWTGATYILLASCCTIALYSKPIAIAALAFIVVGDTAAALIGRRWGKHKIGRKSIEGSLGCLAATLLVAWLAPGLSFPVAACGAIAATLFEFQPVGVDDNVTVPILSGLVMTFVQKML